MGRDYEGTLLGRPAGSGAAPEPSTTATGDVYAEIVSGLLAEAAGDTEWQLRRVGAWLHADSGASPRTQGWKLHLSAALSDAVDVLRRAVPILAAEAAPFKVAASPADLVALNGARSRRESSGKFLTVYPHDDVQAVLLATRLDEATAGLHGPAILSDRRYRPGSLVHYRYGAFRGLRYVSNDGEVLRAIVRPDGRLEADRREPRFSPPAWVRPPFPSPDHPAGSARVTPDQPRVLLADRFLVRQAIGHTNKGGVFRALDTDTGADVIVKQARAHVGGDERGVDAGDLLRNEAAVLDALGALEVAPRPVLLFEQSGDVFLAQESVPGITLRAWVEACTIDEVAPDGAAAFEVARGLAEVVARVHQAGVVLGDLNPDHIMVGAGLEVRLIDVEQAQLPGSSTTAAADMLTAGYVAPEVEAGGVPDVAADRFSLGAVLCSLFTGDDPRLDPDRPDVRSSGEAFVSWLAQGRRALLVPGAVRSLIVDLLDDAPTARPDAATVAARLRTLAHGSRPSATAADVARAAVSDLRPLPAESCDAAIADLVAGIVASATPGDERYWPTSVEGRVTDGRNVAHGASGIITALVQAWRATGDDTILETVADAAGWLSRRLDAYPQGPVGLFFGTVGQAWALAEAGDALRDPVLITRGVELAMRIRTNWPGPDVSLGRAGLGIGLLHLYERTGDDALLTAAGACADSLIQDMVVSADGSVAWYTPGEFRSALAGRTFYGHHRGTAGIAGFLLALAEVDDREDCRAVASAVLDTLVTVGSPRDGTMTWSESPDDIASSAHLAHGAAGIAAFLLDAYERTGDPRLPSLIDGAARTVMAAKWRAGAGYGGGLAGDGDMLLDAWRVLDDETYWLWAADLAGQLHDRRVVQRGRIAIGDGVGTRTPDFHGGLAGVLSFLVRLRHGGARLWTLDRCRTPLA